MDEEREDEGEEDEPSSLVEAQPAKQMATAKMSANNFFTITSPKLDESICTVYN